jgi:crotonobetainyl-CoA:carnitine CoA-transferase CaiB-like acyl-CoA transferase
VRFSDTQPADNFSADSLGQSTRQVLGAVGYSDAELDALTRAGVTN